MWVQNPLPIASRVTLDRPLSPSSLCSHKCPWGTTRELRPLRSGLHKLLQLPPTTSPTSLTSVPTAAPTLSAMLLRTRPLLKQVLWNCRTVAWTLLASPSFLTHGPLPASRASQSCLPSFLSRPWPALSLHPVQTTRSAVGLLSTHTHSLGRFATLWF